MTSAEQIKSIVKDYVLANEEDFVDKSFEDICESVVNWIDPIIENAVNDGVEEAMNSFPPDHDPYDEIKEILIAKKHGIDI